MPLPRSRVLAPACAYVVLATADTFLAASPSASRHRWRWLTKPLLMPALSAAFTAAAADPAREPVSELAMDAPLLQRGTSAAQALSWLGDVSLMGKSEPAFLAGLGSFFGAHVAYVGAFASAGRPVTDTSHLGGVKAALALMATVGPAMGYLAGRQSPKLRGPVMAYAGILSAMYASSTRLDPSIPEPARRTVGLGTTLFLASDFTLGVRRFAMKNPGVLSDGLVMATYTAGQGLIAAGVAQAVRSRR